MTWLQIYASRMVQERGHPIMSRHFTMLWWLFALLFWLWNVEEGGHSCLPCSTRAYWLYNSPSCDKAVHAVKVSYS